MQLGERAQKVVIKGGRIERYRSQWGGQACPEVLLDGPAGLDEDLKESRREDQWMDPDFAEGGYLVDFDRRRILIYSWHNDLLERLMEDLKPAWPDWSIEAVEEGVPDFQRHVDTRSASSGS